MTQRSIRIGSLVNIQTYDDADFDSAIETIMPIKAGDPIDANDVVTLGFTAFKKAAVAAITNPTELAAIDGKNGDIIVAQQIAGGTVQDSWTLYAYDASGPALNSPYVVDAFGPGDARWVAVGGRYSALSVAILGALTVIGALAVTDEAFGVTWDGILGVPTKNAVYDQLVIMLAQIATKATIQSPGGPHTVPLFKITPGGTDGSLTFNAEGVVTAFVDPT